MVYHDTAECPAPVVLGDCPRALIGDGGLFFEQKSTTWAEQTTMENAKAFPENDFTSLNDSDIWGIDMIHLNATTTVEAFPIAISTHRTFPLNSIGLGLNSSLLDALNASGKIMSSTWSVFWGLIGAEAQNQMDGSVILGGFDRAKTTGNNLTLPVQTATDCRTGLVVMVQDISMEFASGKAQSILDSPLEMCIDPSFQLVSLPSGVMDLFSKNAGGSFLRLADGLYNHGMVYKLKDV